MKAIERLTIRNFRNIKAAEYHFGERTAIRGRNHIGKTNALQALYWVLTDTMLENTNDFDTIIPHDDSRALTEVTVTFEDGTTFGKTYREKWTKTRGSDTETLTGHETCFYFNGTLIKTKAEATSILKNLVFEEATTAIMKYPMVDMTKAVTNPLYLFGQEEWKAARQFIIAMVGDVSDDAIFAAHPELASIRDDLRSMNGHADMLAKKYADSLKALKAQLTQVSTNQDFSAKKMEDNRVSDEEARAAKKVIEDIQEGLEQVREGAKNAENPLLTQKKHEVDAMQNEIATLQREIAEDENKHFETYTMERQNAMNDWSKQCNKVNEIQADIDRLTRGKSETEMKIASTEQELELAKQKKQRLYDQYKEIKAREFHFKETVCPHCGAVINSEDEEKARQEFENRNNGDAVDCIARGRACATEISRLEAEVEAYRRKLTESSDSTIAQLQNELASASQKRELKKQFLDSILPYRSPRHDELDRMRAEKVKLEGEARQIAASENNNADTLINQYLQAKEGAKTSAQTVLDRKAVYESARADFENLKNERTIINHSLTVTDEKKESMKQFIIAKLHMINASTARVFPDIEFVLIEPNIKEGSFNEVCYPLIKGKKTPFINGSNSERIMTGIAIINDIRKFLELPKAAIIFDEGETLDSWSIGAIETDSQIVTTVVDDNYSEPTAVLIR